MGDNYRHLNNEVLRVTLESRMMLLWEETPDGKTLHPTMVNALKVEQLGQTKSGRDKWEKALPGPLIADEDHPRGGMSYSDLLRSLARVLDDPDGPEPEPIAESVS